MGSNVERELLASDFSGAFGVGKTTVTSSREVFGATGERRVRDARETTDCGASLSTRLFFCGSTLLELEALFSHSVSFTGSRGCPDSSSAFASLFFDFRRLDARSRDRVGRLASLATPVAFIRVAALRPVGRELLSSSLVCDCEVSEFSETRSSDCSDKSSEDFTEFEIDSEEVVTFSFLDFDLRVRFEGSVLFELWDSADSICALRFLVRDLLLTPEACVFALFVFCFSGSFSEDFSSFSERDAAEDDDEAKLSPGAGSDSGESGGAAGSGAATR